MTEKELIFNLRQLKKITPKNDWVVLTKTNILGSNLAESSPAQRAGYMGIFSTIFSLVYGKRKFAYSFAVLLFIFIGVYSFMNFYSLQQAKIASNNLLMVQAELANNVQILAEKYKNLSEAVEKNPEKVGLAIEETEIAVKNVTNSIKKDPTLAKTALEVISHRTYLNVVGSDQLKVSSDDLYKTIDEQIITDLSQVTLTQSQQESLKEIKDLYNKGEYSLALENIFMLQSSLANEQNNGDSEGGSLYLDESGQQPALNEEIN